MPFYFNSLIEQAELEIDDVILVRHQEKRETGGPTAFTLWRDNTRLFEQYQARQVIKNRKIFSKPFWASFLATPSGETMFVGMYRSRWVAELDVDTPHILGGEPEKAHHSDCYEQRKDERFTDFEARLFIDWGDSYKAWKQYASKQNKPIIEYRKRFAEPDFPGLMNFIEPLSRITELPSTWVAVLKNTRGVYLLTCPRTKEQYVGSAYGVDGFYGRWIQYATNGHGDTVRLKSRERSDYQVCILEVASNNLLVDEIIRIEQKWKERLRTREMGLNGN